MRVFPHFDSWFLVVLGKGEAHKERDERGDEMRQLHGEEFSEFDLAKKCKSFKGQENANGGQR